MESEFKVWCKDKKEWEKDLCVLTPYGELLMDLKGRFIPLLRENHEAVFWTGLRDIKRTAEYPEGEKIYNQYIVNYTDGEFTRRKGIIEFESFGYLLREIDGGYQIGFLSEIDDFEEFAFEVIGNAFENPELLEVE